MKVEISDAKSVYVISFKDKLAKINKSSPEAYVRMLLDVGRRLITNKSFRIWKLCGEQGVIPELARIAKLCSHSIDIVYACLSMLRNLSRYQKNSSKIVTSGGVKILLQIMQMPEQARAIKTLACVILYNLCIENKSKSVDQIMTDPEAVPLLCNCLICVDKPDDLTDSILNLYCAVCDLISSLVYCAPKNGDAFLKQGIIAQLRCILTVCAGVESVVVAVLDLLCDLGFQQPMVLESDEKLFSTVVNVMQENQYSCRVIYHGAFLFLKTKWYEVKGVDIGMLYRTLDSCCAICTYSKITNKIVKELKSNVKNFRKLTVPTVSHERKEALFRDLYRDMYMERDNVLMASSAQPQEPSRPVIPQVAASPPASNGVEKDRKRPRPAKLEEKRNEDEESAEAKGNMPSTPPSVHEEKRRKSETSEVARKKYLEKFVAFLKNNNLDVPPHTEQMKLAKKIATNLRLRTRDDVMNLATEEAYAKRCADYKKIAIMNHMHLVVWKNFTDFVREDMSGEEEADEADSSNQPSVDVKSKKKIAESSTEALAESKPGQPDASYLATSADAEVAAMYKKLKELEEQKKQIAADMGMNPMQNYGQAPPGFPLTEFLNPGVFPFGTFVSSTGPAISVGEMNPNMFMLPTMPWSGTVVLPLQPQNPDTTSNSSSSNSKSA